MPGLQDPPGLLASGVADWPQWMGQASFWIVALAAVAAVAGAVGVWVGIARLRELLVRSRELDHLVELLAQVKKIAADRDDLDLRRIEHVLIELRDDQKRLEDALLRSMEAGRPAANGAHATALGPPAADGLGERAVNRLLALGYERVQLVTRAEKVVELGARDGEILIEARRQGVLHKGRVLVRGGRIADVEMHPAYSIFP